MRRSSSAQGRTFNDGYGPGEPWAAIIDEKIAEQYYSGRDPIAGGCDFQPPGVVLQ